MKLILSASSYKRNAFKMQSNCKYIQAKGKAVPLQAWSGPEGSRKLRFPDFVTTNVNNTGTKQVSIMK